MQMDYTWVNQTMIDEREAQNSHGRRLDVTDEAFKQTKRNDAIKSFTLIKTCVPSKEGQIMAKKERNKNNNKAKANKIKRSGKGRFRNKPRTKKNKGFKDRHNQVNFKTCLTDQNSMIIVVGQYTYDSSNVIELINAFIERDRRKYFVGLFTVLLGVGAITSLYLNRWADANIIIPLENLHGEI